MNNLGVRGEYGFQVLRTDGSIKEEVPCVPNILLDSFFNFIQTYPDSGSSYSNRLKILRIGTGTAEPVATQTQLVNTVYSVAGGDGASYTTSNISTDGTTWSASMTLKFVFPVGAFAGNITEVGLAFLDDVVSNAIHSRTLIKDGFGVLRPITITLQDQLVVTYKLTMTGPEVVTGMIALNGSNYAYECRRPNFSSSGIGDILFSFNTQNSGAFPPTASFNSAGENITGTSRQSFSPTPSALSGTVAGQRRVQVAFPTTSGNIAEGIGFIHWAGFAKIKFTPPIPKTSDQIFNLTLGYIIGRA